MGTTVIAKPTTVKVLVLSPGGKGIDHALVKVTSTKLQTPAAAYTDTKGVAVLILADTLFTKDVNEDKDPSSASVVITASKAHHGPVVVNAPFKNGPASASVSVLKQGSFDKATKNLDNQDRLKMVLLDGGELGVKHSDIPTRKLKTKEVVDAVMYHYANGDIGLKPESEFICKHVVLSNDPDGELGTPCTDKCEISALPQNNENRLNLASTTLCGVKTLFITNDTPPDTIVCDNTGFNGMTRRYTVGLARLCAMIYKEGYRVLYSASPGGTAADDSEGAKNKYKISAHFQGRAIDINGVAKTLNTTTSGKIKLIQNFKARPNDDFCISHLWGAMKMKVHPASGAPVEWDEDAAIGGKYAYVDSNGNDVPSASGKITYRLEIEPSTGKVSPKCLSTTIVTEIEKQAKAGPVDKATLTSNYLDYLTEGSKIFKKIYEFLIKEFSISTVILGDKNTENYNPIPDMGSLRGYLFFPEYPVGITDKDSKDGRQPHHNHFHAQLGDTFWVKADDDHI